MYEKYADKFKLTEDDNYFYLDYNGDVTGNLGQIGKMQRAFFPTSNLFTKGKRDIKSCEADIHLVMKKGMFGSTPCEIKIKLTTKLYVADYETTIENEDNFQAFYRDINKVKEIKKPYGFDESKAKPALN